MYTREQIQPRCEQLIEDNADLLNPKNWNDLSIVGKRNAILLDAMKQLIIGNYLPFSSYTDSYTIFEYIDEDRVNRENKELQDLMNEENFPNCYVCQRGALLLSCVRFNDNLTVAEYGAGGVDRTEDKAGLNNFVPLDEREQMELHFENPLDSEFSKAYVDENKRKDRLDLSLAIFLNAFEEGKFNPEKWYPQPEEKFEEIASGVDF